MVRCIMKFLLRLKRSVFLCLDIMQCRQLTEELLQVWLNLLPYFSLMRFPESAVQAEPLHETRLLRPDLRREIPGPEGLDTPQRKVWRMQVRRVLFDEKICRRRRILVTLLRKEVIGQPAIQEWCVLRTLGLV